MVAGSIHGPKCGGEEVRGPVGILLGKGGVGWSGSVGGGKRVGKLMPDLGMKSCNDHETLGLPDMQCLGTHMHQ